MATEIEARACRHAFITRSHLPLRERAFGPLMVWVAFYGLAIVSGLLAR